VRKDDAGIQTSGHFRHGLEAIHGDDTYLGNPSLSIRRTSQNPIDMGVLRSQGGLEIRGVTYAEQLNRI
jgi:hypothetical protein